MYECTHAYTSIIAFFSGGVTLRGQPDHNGQFRKELSIKHATESLITSIKMRGGLSLVACFMHNVNGLK